MTTDLLELYCDGCGEKMGDVTWEEFCAAGADDIRNDVFCFDCSPDEADKIHPFFWDYQDGDVFFLDGGIFEIVQEFPYYLKMVFLSHAHDLTRARSCLSSSTYLNTFPNQKVKWERAIRTNAKCSDCENVNLVENDLGLTCPNCKRIFALPEWVILPVWLVGLDEREKKVHHPIPSECVDCLCAVLEGGEYCSYHYALLIEQDEDGRMGVGDE
jgi:hypothetical protein